MKRSGEFHRGNERILLVDDHPTVLDTIKTLLELCGYSVLQTLSAKTAIQIASKYANKIDILITDIHMPDMNGRELAKHLLTDYSDMKCLFMTAYANGSICLPNTHFIHKPFSASGLTTKIREVLDQ